MNETLRKSIDDALPGILKQAKATRAVNKMMRVSGERIVLPLADRNVEIVYYRSPVYNAPLIIGYHSGGWLFGGCALNDRMWTEMVSELGVNIASVGYRLAPDFKWRDSLADAYDSAMYLMDHSDEFGFNMDDVTLLGPSAGGNMAAAMGIQALQEGRMNFRNIILLYPLLDVETEPELKGTENYGGPSAYIMNEQHILPEEAHYSLASPVFAGTDELKGFPRTLIFTAENDALKHEAERFAEHLKEAGSEAEYFEMPGMAHCYFELGFRNKLTEFEAGFIGPKGVEAFDNGRMEVSAAETMEIIKNRLYKEEQNL